MPINQLDHHSLLFLGYPALLVFPAHPVAQEFQDSLKSKQKEHK